VHRVAVAIALDLHDLARLDAHLHLHRSAGTTGVHRLLLQAGLDLDARGDRVRVGLEHREDAVAEQLHDTAAVLLEGPGQGRRQLRDESAGRLVAEPLEDAGAPYEVSEYDSGHG